MDLSYPRKNILTFAFLGATLSAVGIALFVMLQIQTPEYKYNSNFKKVHEPKLRDLPNNHNSIRLIIDYGHKFDTIRISQSDSALVIRGIGFYHDNLGGKFQLVHDSSAPLEIFKWNELMGLISKSRILEIPSEAKQRPILDGEIWTLEVQLQSSYKKIVRLSPKCFPELAEFEKICNAITKIANYDFYAFSQPNQSFNPDATSSSHFHHRNAPLR